MKVRTTLQRLLPAVLCTLVLSPPVVLAQAPIQVFYVPLPEDQIRAMFLTLNPALPDTSIRTTIAITAAGNNTRIYYDHWEDGYEADLANPVQATSQIWGDANLATGAPPGCGAPACDVINAGRVITLQNDVFVNPRNPGTILFDGRDKFGSTLLVAATQAGWGVITGTILADAIEIFPVNDWGTSYEAPGGENFGPPSEMFQDARFIIIAQRDNTIVRVDINRDGTDDIIQVLNEGQTMTVDGVLVGTRVNANLPILASMLTGDIGATYEMRWFSMVPRNRWTNRYIAPVATTEPSTTEPDPVVVLLYNPHSTSLNVTATTRSGSSVVPVPAGGLVKFVMPLTTPPTAALFEALDGRPFFAISSIDDESTTHDWGYTLLPASTLAPAVKAGWAPGSDIIGVENSSPIWVTAASATTLNVDWNDDGTVDLTVPIAALESVQLRDPDGDQTGTRVFTTDGTLISAAWGQDPLGASPAAPALDLGTSVLPLPDVAILKNATLANDANGNGLLDPGDTLFYSLFVINTGVVDADNVIVTDVPDQYTTYELNTTLVGGAPHPDDAPPATPFPLDETGINIGTLTPGQGVIIRYERQVGDPLPSPQQTIINTARVSYGLGVVVSSSNVNPVTPPQFNVTKTSNLTGPALPGQVITYTLSILNNSPITQTTITVDDPLPSGTTYVAQSTTATAVGPTQTYRDEFNAAAYNNNNGTLNWSTNWTEVDSGAGGGSPTTGDIGVFSDGGALRLRIQDNDNSAQRRANLTGFTSATLSFLYRRNSLDNADDWVDVQVSSTGAAPFTQIIRYSGPTNNGGYVAASFDISAFISANTTIRFLASPDLGGGDQVYFDDIQIADPIVVTKTNQAASPNPLIDGNPPNLVLAGDGFSLAPNQTMTVTYQVRIDDPLNPFLPEILNEAWIDSDQSLSPTRVTRLDPVAPGSILGDRVWLDVDGDGVQDVGEDGLSNVRVLLLRDPDGIPANGDEIVADSTFTDGNGNYLFDRIYPPPSGSYYVEVDPTTLPAGLSPSPGNNNGRSASIVITGLQTILDLDFGYTAAPGSAIAGDRIWSDADGDGIQDPGEVGIGGVTVDLVAAGADGLFGTADDVVVATRTTASDGTYLFVGVAPGIYRIDVTDVLGALAGYTLTFGPEPTNPINLTSGAVDVSRDFGYRNPALFSIADAVWNDIDGDGVRDPGENGIEGVTIALRDGSGNLLGTTLTDANGNFQFSGVGDGSYTIVVTDSGGLLTNAAPTTTHANAGQRAVTVAGTNVANSSFGYRTLGTIGELVWSDADGDGVRDPNESGIPGVTVNAVIAGLDGIFGTVDDSIYATATTAADGTYRFTSVPRGYYQIQVASALPGYTQTGDPDSTLDGTGDVPLQSGATDLTMNFGYQNAALADVSGTVFDDTDLDGVQDASENGIAGVTLNLTAAGADGIFGTVDDLVLATTATAAGGAYSFPDVPNGSYRVVVTDTGNVLNGYTLTSGLDAIDVTISGSDVSGIDFGYARVPGTSSIGTRVWLDANRDGVSNPSEDGIGNVRLNLYTPGPDGIIGNGDDVFVASTTTDTNGYYRFGSLGAGDYYVDVDGTTLPGGLAPTVGTSDPTGVIQLADGQTYIGANFGYASASGSAIGDSVFFDANGDGFQNPGEPGIGGVSITVTGPSGTFTVVTAADGSWLVAGLAPGGYNVTVNTATLPSGYNTIPTNGPASRGYVLSAGLDFLRADFGFDAPAGVTGSIGDRVFFDANGNGVEDGGDGGISGVTLRLLDAGGTIVATTTTDTNGNYDFVGLAPGDYRVEVTDLYGALSGLNLSAGSNPSGVVSLGAGGDVNNIDFGYASSGGAGSIGGFIWHDSDGSGAVNGLESSLGLQGVSVNLYLDVNANGVLDPGVDNLVRTTTTDVIGQYQFNGVPAGRYLVDVTDTSGVLVGFAKTSGAAGVDNNSQADPYAVVLSAGTSNFTADFGYLASGTNAIRGTTFFDVVGDGLYNGGDSGVEDVSVFLYRDLNGDGILDSTDPRIGFLKSDVNGDYDFGNLPDGDFIVAVDVTGTYLQSSYQTTQLSTRGVEPVSLAGADSNGNDFGFNLSATLVTITRFDAYDEGGRVVVEWVTGSEVGTLGFYLFRWDAAQARYLQVNDSLLPGLRAPQGGRYRLVDETAPRRGAVTYLLYEAEEGGSERRYGPFEVHLGPRSSQEPMAGTFERRARRQSSAMVERAERGQERRRRAATRHSDRTRGSRTSKSEAALKLAVRERGLYFVSSSTIAAAFAVPETTAATLVSRSALRLTNRGEDVAWLGSSDGSGLYFYGERLETLYTDENVYWLELGSGLRMGSVAARPVADGPAFHVRTEHLEKDVFAATIASTDPDADFWYWSSLMASFPAYRTATYAFEASAVEPIGPRTKLVVHAFGATTTPHRLRVRINGIDAGEGAFQGVGAAAIPVDFDSSLLVNGANNVTVEAVLEYGVAFDVVYVDGLDVSYPRRHEALTDELGLTAAGTGAVLATGFSSDETVVLDVTAPLVPALATDVSRGGGAVRFEAQAGRSYYASSTAALRQPAASVMESLTTLGTGAAEYIVVTPASLEAAAHELADYRESQGLTTRVVTLETLHDEFGFGIPSPHNVKKFLGFARGRWRTPPRFVVLVGKGTYDFKDSLAKGDNLMPPLMAATPLGLYASDNRLADVAGNDGVPEFMIGRLPVLSDDELRAFIRKLQAFEGGGLGEALFTADDPDVAGNFPVDSNQLIAEVPDDVAVHRVYLSYLPLAQARQQVFQRLDAGVGFWNYIGHGGLDRFANEGLVLTADVAGLANAQTPIVASLTCTAGRFEIPGWSSLGEALVMKEDGGAVATWAPSGLSYNSQAIILNRALVRALYDDSVQYLGEAVSSALLTFSEEGKLRFMLSIYNLLGDPATRIR